MRLIDADILKEKMKCTNRYFNIKFDIDESPTIDPETLTIVQQLRAENKSLRLFFDDITSKPDCNTCGNKACIYKPEIGQTTRFNCPLWIESKEE